MPAPTEPKVLAETVLSSTERSLTCPWCKGPVRVDLSCFGIGHGDQGQQLVSITGQVRAHRCKWRTAQ